MKKLPSRIQILGQDIKVEHISNMVSLADCHGDWDLQKNTIRVQSLTDEHPKDACFVSYFHEVVHAALDLTGHQDLSKDENFVERMAQALYQAEKTRRYD